MAPMAVMPTQLIPDSTELLVALAVTVVLVEPLDSAETVAMRRRRPMDL